MAATEAQIKALVEAYCNIKLSSTSVTEFMDGGFEDLIVKIGPIVSITSITDTHSTQATSDDDVLTATAYNFNAAKGEIFRYDGCDWEKGRNRWKVVYVAGLQSIPADLQLAIDRWLEYYTDNSNGILNSYTTGDDSESYNTSSVKDIPSNVRLILDKYKRVIYQTRYYY